MPNYKYYAITKRTLLMNHTFSEQHLAVSVNVDVCRSFPLFFMRDCRLSDLEQGVCVRQPNKHQYSSV